MPYYDQNDPLSFGMDMPSQGGMFGTDDSSRLLQMIRFRNLFGIPQQPTNPDINDQNNGVVNPFDNQDSGNADIRDLYQPDTRMEDRMRQLLDQIPQREKPGLGRKIVATLAGLGGVDKANEVLDEPYNEAYGDWKNQFDPVFRAANDERMNNINRRQLAANVVSERNATKRIGIMQQGADTRQDQGQQRIDLSTKRFEEKKKVDEAIAKGGTFKVDDAGNAVIVYKDGSTAPVNMDYLDFQTKQDIIQKRQVAVAGQAAAAKSANERHRVVSAERDDPNTPGQKIKGSLDLDTGIFTDAVQGADKSKVTNTPKSAAGTKDNAALIKQKEADAAQMYITQHPEARAWIKNDPKTGIHVTKPGENWVMSNPTEEQYKDMQTSIFGGGNPNFQAPNIAKRSNSNTTNDNSPNTTNDNSIPPPPPPDKRGKPSKPGMIFVYSKSHKTHGWADPNDVQIGKDLVVVK